VFNDTVVLDIALTVIIVMLGNISFQLHHIEKNLDSVNDNLKRLRK